MVLPRPYHQRNWNSKCQAFLTLLANSMIGLSQKLSRKAKTVARTQKGGVSKLPKIVSPTSEDSIYYYDNRKTCRVRLPEIPLKAIVDAESLNNHGEQHCDLIFIGMDGTKTKIYLIELRDINNPDPVFVSEVLSPDTVKNKAKGSLRMIKEEMCKVYPSIDLMKGDVDTDFVVIVGPGAMQVLSETTSLLTRIRSNFAFLASLGLTGARIKASESNVYKETYGAFELL